MPQTAELISVIVPVYNVKDYLVQCVKSIINQTYKDIEILLIDDGSTDGSGKICDSLSNKFPIVKVIHKKNEGLGLTRNVGILNAKGKYVTFIDSDDYIAPSFIENLVLGLKKYNVDSIISGFKRIDSNNNIFYKEEYKIQVYEDDDVMDKVFTKMLGSLPEKHDSLKMSVWGNLYSMEIIKRYNLYFVSERKIISEDIIWNNDYFKKIRRVAILPFCDYYYRSNDNSLSLKYNPKRFQQVIYLYLILKQIIKEDHLPQNALLRTQKQFFVNIRSCISQLQNLFLKKHYQELLTIINDDTLQEVLSQYPIERLNTKQKIFLLLLKNRDAKLLFILNKSKLI